MGQVLKGRQASPVFPELEETPFKKPTGLKFIFFQRRSGGGIDGPSGMRNFLQIDFFFKSLIQLEFILVNFRFFFSSQITNGLSFMC